MTRCGAAANNGLVVGTVFATTGGNSALKPETANTLGLGVVFEPSSVPGLSVTVDYYRLVVDDVIGSYGAQYIVNKCYGVGTSRDMSFCPLVTRSPATQTITNVLDVIANVGALEASGFDLGAGYQLSTLLGVTTLQAGISNVLDSAPPAIYDSALTYADPAYDFVGRAFYARVRQVF